MAEETTAIVLSKSTQAAIEKMAEEFAKEMLADDEFRKELRAEALRAAKAVAASLRQ